MVSSQEEIEAPSKKGTTKLKLVSLLFIRSKTNVTGIIAGRCTEATKLNKTPQHRLE